MKKLCSSVDNGLRFLSMNDLMTFDFMNSEIRTLLMADEPWFVLKDVCSILGLSNPSMIVDRLDADERAKYNLGRQGDTWIINESGLYKVIFQSKKADAKRFTNWVTKEVLPTIRKTGSYQVPTDPMQALQLMFEAQKSANEKVQHLDNRVLEIEQNLPLSPGEYNLVSKKVSERVGVIRRERWLTLNKKQISLLYKAINSDIKVVTGVDTRSQLRQRHLYYVLEFIRDWEPSKAVIALIEQAVGEAEE